LQANWRSLASPEHTAEILRGDVLKLLPRFPPRQFDLIYFDPPYASALYSPVLEAISETRILAPTGELAIEHDRNFTAPLEIEGLRQRDQKRYGKTFLSFYQATDIR
jgi:16S rRNA G966 N2-methylase RsmD